MVWTVASRDGGSSWSGCIASQLFKNMAVYSNKIHLSLKFNCIKLALFLVPVRLFATSTVDKKALDHNTLLNEFQLKFGKPSVNSYKKLCELASLDSGVKKWLVVSKKNLNLRSEVELSYHGLGINPVDYENSRASLEKISTAQKTYAKEMSELAKSYEVQSNTLLAVRNVAIRSCEPLARILCLSSDQLCFEAKLRIVDFMEPGDEAAFRIAKNKFIKDEVQARRAVLLGILYSGKTVKEDDFYPSSLT